MEQTEGYRPAVGRPVSRQEYIERMSEQQDQPQQDQPQPQQDQPQQDQPQAGPGVEELEAMRQQQEQARQLLLGGATPAGGGAFGANGQPLIIGQAPDGGPLQLDPGLVSQARMLALGAGIGGLLVLVWWARARAGVVPHVAEPAEDK